MKSVKRSEYGALSVAWILWIVGSVVSSAVLAIMMFGGHDQTLFMPGPLSTGHHQLVDSCGSCHTSEFGGDEILQDACIDCHGDERDDDIDTHPISKFKDPRNANRLEKIDATFCITCHVEHQPSITHIDGLTQPKDFCAHCHLDIAEERPSHTDMGFETCASSGCHNYHDNRALYTKFIIDRRDDMHHLQNPFLLHKDFSETVSDIMEYPHDKFPLTPLDVTHIDAPASVVSDAVIERQWLESSHAAAGVSCGACHLVATEEDSVGSWVDRPGFEGCEACHAIESAQFGEGKHGMRIAQALTPMTPALAVLPMHPEAAHEELTCASCHEAHEFNVVTASVESCEQCHADDHTVAYRQSTHYALWLAEIEGSSEPGSGVSCASCHMPRESQEVNDWMERVVVNHNQNDTLSPNSKMLRPVCLSCHGLEFSLNALADEQLIERNFNGEPAVQVDSVNMARKVHAEHERKRAARDNKTE